MHSALGSCKLDTRIRERERERERESQSERQYGRERLSISHLAGGLEVQGQVVSAFLRLNGDNILISSTL